MSAIELMQCFDCREIFERAEATRAEEPVSSEFWGARAVSIQTYLCCPNCGSDQLEDFFEEEPELVEE